MVMSGVPASDGRWTRARPASHVWNASVDVRSRTRRNAYTISGAAPEVNHRMSCRGSRGSASLVYQVTPGKSIGSNLNIQLSGNLLALLLKLPINLQAGVSPPEEKCLEVIVP